MYRKLPNCEEKTICVLCLGRKAETIEHLLECPAFKCEVANMRSTLQCVLQESKFPFASTQLPAWPENLIRNWCMAAERLTSPILSRPRLEQMAWDFFYANKHKSFVGTRHFVERVSRAVDEDEKRRGVEINMGLLTLLVSCFNLGLEGNSSALRRCVIESLIMTSGLVPNAHHCNLLFEASILTSTFWAPWLISRIASWTKRDFLWNLLNPPVYSWLDRLIFFPW